MQTKVIYTLTLIVLFITTACTTPNSDVSPAEAKYKSCIEDEISKLLDETGSNFESAQAVAIQACAYLQPSSNTK